MNRRLKIYLCGKMGNLSLEEMNSWRKEIKEKLLVQSMLSDHDVLIINPVDFYNFDTVEEKSYKMGIHSHERHEMYYLESGEVTYFLGNQIIPLTTGEIVFVPKGTPLAKS